MPGFGLGGEELEAVTAFLAHRVSSLGDVGWMAFFHPPCRKSAVDKP
jgi:hypothetical protein